jgi:hypothetical protein
MHFEEVIVFGQCHANMTEKDTADVGAAFHKVFANLDALR